MAAALPEDRARRGDARDHRHVPDSDADFKKRPEPFLYALRQLTGGETKTTIIGSHHIRKEDRKQKRPDLETNPGG